MCEIFERAPDQIKAVVIPILTTMDAPNMLGCYAEMRERGVSQYMLGIIWDWLDDNCRLCAVCEQPVRPD